MLSIFFTLVYFAFSQVIAPEPPKLTEMLPGIRVAEGVVEFEGTVPIDAHHPDTPDVYLEMFITAPDSREHEALVLSRIKPSNLHAALLAAGFENGAPYSIDKNGKEQLATGDELEVLVAVVGEDQSELEFVPLTGWAVHIDKDHEIHSDARWDGFVFAGSKLTSRGYEADGTGTIASLTTFGNEVIAPKWTVSHLAEVDEPVWIANRERLPKKGASLVVRIVAHEPEASHQPDGVDIDRNP